jgi:putative ABC transport system permease protein
MSHAAQPGAPRTVARAAGALLIAVLAQALITIGHFLYGVHRYEDPGRLHVVVPAVVSLALAAAATAALVRWPRRIVALVLAVVVAVPFVGTFGIFHGAYSHLLKCVMWLAGAPPGTLQGLFDNPDFVVPDDVLFELSGIAGFGLAILIAIRLVQVLRAVWRGRSDAGTPTRGEERRDRVAPAPAPDAAPGLGTARAGGPFRLVGLALRMLFDAPFKSLGTLIGVTVSVFLMAQQSSLLIGILGRVTSFVRSSGVDVWITSLATESTDATDTIPASRLAAAAGTRGVAWAAPVVQGIGKVTRPDGVREFVKVLGVEAPRYAGLPRTLAPGTDRSSLRASRRILLNWNDRPTFASAEVGDRIEIDGQAAIVSGFFQGMDPHSPYYYMFANIDDARAFTEFPQDRVTFITVGAAPGVALADLRARLQERIPEVLVKTRDEMSAMEERYFLVRTPVGLVFGMGSIVAALIGAAIVAVTLYSSAIDRARDYGTLKAIGARQRDILNLLLVQAWLFFAAGCVVGIAIFFVVRAHLPQLPMPTPPRLFAGVAVAAFLSCTVASLAAIRRVLSVDPAIVFRG